MFNLSEEYLKEVGVAIMPQAMQDEIIPGIIKSIQGKISIKMSEQLSDLLINEFDYLTLGTADEVRNWLVKVIPYYIESPEYVTAMKESGASEDDFVKAYGVTKWLEMNVPNYSQLVADAMEETKQGLIAAQQR
jgi:hypothetical protein